MRICEHENVCCPYCGAEDDPISDKPSSAGQLSNNTLRPAHEVTCSKCLGVFWLPCED